MTVVIVSKKAVAEVERLRPSDYVDSLRANASQETETHFFILRDRYNELCRMFRPADLTVTPVPVSGPGTEMKALLARIGITSSPTCSCNKRAKMMDEKGCDWCEEHIEEIDGWLAEEARNRKLPYLSLAGKTLINLAIRRARKNAAR